MPISIMGYRMLLETFHKFGLKLPKEEYQTDKRNAVKQRGMLGSPDQQ